MNPTNKQELIETILSILGIADRTSGNRPEQIATLEQELTAHTNAEIAKVLDKIMWAYKNPLEGTGYLSIEHVIAAERAKLEEVK